MPAPTPQSHPPLSSIKPHYDDSDSDSDSGSDSQESVTEVSLGLPDGPLDPSDESNPLVSRIGGKVAWLPIRNLPPKQISLCQQCGKEMQMLVQIFAPLMDSPYDRELIIWGCSRAVCQRKGNGSIKAIRVLQHNPRWAAKLKKQKEKREAKEALQQKKAEEKRLKMQTEIKAKESAANPFSMTGNSKTGSGLGSSLFGSTSAASSASQSHLNPFAISTEKTAHEVQEDHAPNENESAEEGIDEEEEEDSGDEQDEESSRLEEELKIKEKLTQTSDKWSCNWSLDSTHYSPSLYLNTIPEPSRALRLSEKSNALQSELMKKVQDLDLNEKHSNDKSNGSGTEGKEKYESTSIPGLDSVFEKFVKRVGVEGRQVVRYEFGGLPLPFSNKGHVFDLLWPKKTSIDARVEIGRNHHTGSNEPPMQLRIYNDGKIPKCTKCGGKRVFECQLMPNLVNLLKVDNIVKGGDDDESDDQESEADVDGSVDNNAQVDGGVNGNATGNGVEKKTKAQLAEEKRRKDIEKALGRSLPTRSKFGEDGISRSKPTSREQGDSLPPRTGLNWSTALIYVCENDCSEGPEGGDGESESWREEWVGLMWED